MRSPYLNNSRRTGDRSASGEFRSPVFKPIVAPALLIWMRGSRGWYAFDVCDAPIVGTSEMRRWTIAALVVPIFLAGIAIAGTLPGRVNSGPAVEIMGTKPSYDRQRRQVTAVPRPVGGEPGAIVENKAVRTFYHGFYHRKRREITGVRLSIGSTSGIAFETKPARESYDRQRRQLVSLPIGGASGAAETKPAHESYDRQRRQITAADFDFAGSPSVADPILTASLNEFPAIDQFGPSATASESDEKQASIGSSAIPKPIRKPHKARKAVKTTIAKITTKKASGRCWNRIWRC